MAEYSHPGILHLHFICLCFLIDFILLFQVSENKYILKLGECYLLNLKFLSSGLECSLPFFCD